MDTYTQYEIECIRNAYARDIWRAAKAAFDAGGADEWYNARLRRLLAYPPLWGTISEFEAEEKRLAASSPFIFL